MPFGPRTEGAPLGARQPRVAPPISWLCGGEGRPVSKLRPVAVPRAPAPFRPAREGAHRAGGFAPRPRRFLAISEQPRPAPRIPRCPARLGAVARAVEGGPVEGKIALPGSLWRREFANPVGVASPSPLSNSRCLRRRVRID